MRQGRIFTTEKQRAYLEHPIICQEARPTHVVLSFRTFEINGHKAVLVRGTSAVQSVRILGASSYRTHRANDRAWILVAGLPNPTYCMQKSFEKLMYSNCALCAHIVRRLDL